MVDLEALLPCGHRLLAGGPGGSGRFSAAMKTWRDMERYKKYSK